MTDSWAPQPRPASSPLTASPVAGQSWQQPQLFLGDTGQARPKDIRFFDDWSGDMTLGRTARTSSLPMDGGPAQPFPVGHEGLTRMREFCELLWPPPAVITLDGGGRHMPHLPRTARPGPRPRAGAGASTFLLVPGTRRLPLLVPASGRAAAAAVRHYSTRGSRPVRLAAKGFSWCLAGGLGRVVPWGGVRIDAPPGTDTIEAYLGGMIAQDIRLSMYLGPARANRKPVLLILTPAGDPVAFAKIGFNQLTSDLVRTERASLAHLGEAGLTQITVPRVVHHDQWRGLDVLVLSALPADLRARPLSPAKLAAAMSEVSRVGGLHSEPLSESKYLRCLRDRLAGADDGAERAALQQALGDIAARAGDTILTYGAWHGDWAPWNMANTDRGLLVWDWERFACGVPLGFDALHYQLQSQVAPGRRGDPMAMATQCPRRAAPLLAPLGVRAGEARLTATLYLAELAARYLVDRQAKAGARLGAPGEWLIPAVVAEVTRL
jgi:Phosphotransferase enzyme family